MTDVGRERKGHGIAMVKRTVALFSVGAAALLALLWLTMPATAGPGDTEHPVHKFHGTVLASTGLNVATPVIVGLILLAAGLVFVAWAFLRDSSRRSGHSAARRH